MYTFLGNILYIDHIISCILLVALHKKVSSDWLVLDTRNFYIQAKRVGNYYFFYKSIKIILFCQNGKKYNFWCATEF